MLNLVVWTTIVTVWLIAGLVEGYTGIYMTRYLGVSWIIYAAYVKALSTFCKYGMQILHNYKLKSVTGVSPASVTFDLIASTCCLV